jgi:ribosomal protein L1
VESKLQLEFDQRLAKEKEILAAKYDAKVDELHISLGIDIENRDAKISELVTLRGLDDEKHEAKLSVWRA